jgi:hypothetical protein
MKESKIIGIVFIAIGFAMGIWVYTRFTDEIGRMCSWEPPFSSYEVNTFIGAAIAWVLWMVGSIILTIDSLRKVTITIPFKDREIFLSKLNAALAKMGAHRQSQTETFLTFAHTGWKVSVQIEQNSATIVGTSWVVNKLQKQI